MAQVLTEKRQRIADGGVAVATALLDAIHGLQALKLERSQAGNFVDADLETPGLQHLTPFLVGVLFDLVTPQFTALLQETTDGQPASPTLESILLQMRR